MFVKFHCIWLKEVSFTCKCAAALDFMLSCAEQRPTTQEWGLREDETSTTGVFERGAQTQMTQIPQRTGFSVQLPLRPGISALLFAGSAEHIVQASGHHPVSLSSC